MKISVLLPLMKTHINESQQYANFIRLSDLGKEVKSIIDQQSEFPTYRELTCTRNLILDASEFIGGYENSAQIARKNSDIELYSALLENGSGTDRLVQLPGIGVKTAISIMSFLYPTNYSLINETIKNGLIAFSEEYLKENQKNLNDLDGINKFIVTNYVGFGFNSARDFSANILMIDSVLLAHTTNKGCKIDHRRFEKMRIRAKQFLAKTREDDAFIEYSQQ